MPAEEAGDVLEEDPGDRAAREAMIASLESASAQRRAHFLLTDRFGSFDPLTLEELEAFLEDPGD